MIWLRRDLILIILDSSYSKKCLKIGLLRMIVILIIRILVNFDLNLRLHIKNVVAWIPQITLYKQITVLF